MEFRLSDGSFEAPTLPKPITDISASGYVNNSEVLIEPIRAEWAAARINASGRFLFSALNPNHTIGTAESDRWGFGLDVEGVELDSLSLASELGGTISMTSEISGTGLSLDQIAARVEFPKMNLRVGSLPLQQDASARFSLHQGQAQIDHFALIGPNTEIGAVGSVDLFGSHTIDVKLEGTADAGILTLPFPSLSTEGETRWLLTAGGQLGAPVLNGTFELANGQVRFQSPRVEVEKLDVKATLNAGRVVIDRLDGSVNGGSFNGGGSFTLSGVGVTDLKFDIAADNVSADFPEGLRTVSDAQLRGLSENDLTTLTGTVTVQEGTYTRPISLNRLLADSLRLEPTIDFETAPHPSSLARPERACTG